MDPAPGDPSSTVLVLAGGDPVSRDDLASLQAGGFVIAADSGIERAAELGLRVDVAVGDFDSADPAVMAAAEAAGAELVRHPQAKDATDLELALDAAVARRPARVVVVGGHGGRLDHFLANAMLLASERYGAVEIVAQMGPARATVVRRRATIRGVPGDLVSLVAVHGPARGVTTEHLLYPLDDEDLLPGSTRGVSNELAAPAAAVALREGTLLVVQPGQAGTHLRTGSG